MQINRINAAIVTCLEHVATSTSPPGASAGAFMLQLVNDGMLTLDEIDEITIRVGIIIEGISERYNLTQGNPSTVN